MRCKDAQEMVNVWIDGELPPDKRRILEDHLGSCRACSKEADALHRLNDVLNTCPPVKPSARLKEKTMSQFAKETGGTSGAHWWSGLGWQMQAAMTAGALIGLGIGCGLGNGWASTRLPVQYGICDSLFTPLGSLLSWV